MKQTQHQKILNILRDGQFHCVNEFIDTYCVDYRRRLVDLKEKGFEFESRPCQNPLHRHIGGSKQWKLIGEPKVAMMSSEEILRRSIGATN